MLQNMQLATEALGLGGFPHFGAQKYQWFEDWLPDGRRPDRKLTRRGRVVTTAMNLLGKNPVIPHPLGLEVDGEMTVKPYRPPWYGSMEEAVHAYLEVKFGANGVFADGRSGAWRDVPGVQKQVARHTQANIDAVIAYCEYVTGSTGAFRATSAPCAH